jgi:hypothetical protein
MKFAAVLVAAVATFTATASAAECPSTEVLRLLALANEPSIDKCESDSKFNFLPPPGVPTAAQLDRMCASAACTTTLAALKAIGPADCEITFSNGVTLNVKTVLDMYTAAC